MTIKRIESGPRLSHAVVHNGTVYLAGQVASDRSQDITGQTRQVLERIEQLLAEAGSAKDRILFAQIWLKDIEAHFAPMNKVWEAWIASSLTPARATVQAALAAPDILIEIAVTAAVLE